MPRILPVFTRSFVFFLLNAFIFFNTGHAQMRQVYLDANEYNEIYKISFYSGSEGYIGFRDWVGFTADSGKTMVKKHITLSNVNFNNHEVNVTFGFYVLGVKAFDKNNVLAYGHYGLVPAILQSSNGGNSFTLVYHSQFSPMKLSEGITDMIFPENGNIGYAVDADRILKTINKGNSWTVVKTDEDRYYDYLEAVDNNTVWAMSTRNGSAKLWRTTNGGTNWQVVSTPATGILNHAYFITESKGWINLRDENSQGRVYYTSNAGQTWVLKNDKDVTPFTCSKMRFLDDNTGFAITKGFKVYKTTDAGKVWEQVPRNNNYTYLGYSHNDIQVFNSNLLWAGGGHGFLEMNSNASGKTIPGAYFKIDTAGLYLASKVNLVNFSRPGYEYKWYVNDTLISTAYNASYTHDIYLGVDTVRLIVSNGTYRDTAMHLHYFKAVPYPSPEVVSFSPASGGTGTVVTINGNFFSGVKQVTFGGIPASSYSVHSLTKITAVVGAGGNGTAAVTSTTGTGERTGFIFYPPPVITSISPVSGPIGTLVTISGSDFSNTAGSNIVVFGSVKAKVKSATATRLVVEAPAGAGYEPITVTVNKHTAYSPQRFNVTFPSSCGFSEYSFFDMKKFPLSDASTAPRGKFAASDFDGDGKNDVAIITTRGFSVLRNAGFPGKIDFEPNQHYELGGYANGGIAAGDLDGDGKTDLVVSYYSDPVSNGIAVFRNTSTTGKIIFEQRANIQTGDGPGWISIGDLDADGKPDMVVVNQSVNVNTLTLFRNISSGSEISFSGKKQDLKVGVYSNNVQLGDIDGDNKVDIVVGDQVTLPGGINVFTLFPNKSEIGKISFPDTVAIKNYSITTGHASLGDLDGDGKLDIAMVSDARFGAKEPIALYRNTSSNGKMSFAPVVPYKGCQWGLTMSLADFDGDNKIDIAAACRTLLKNAGSPGNLSFVSVDSRISEFLPTGDGMTVADLDGDGKPDLMSMNNISMEFFAMRNTHAEPNAWAGKDTTICQGQNVQLGMYDISDFTFQWTSKPAGFTSDHYRPWVSPSVTTTYYVAVTDNLGCVTLDTIEVKVNGAAPTMDAGKDRVVCYQNSVQIGSAPVPSYTYLWTSVPEGFTSSIANPEFVADVYQREYILTVNNGRCIARDTVEVTMMGKVKADAGPDRSVCSPRTTTIGFEPSPYSTDTYSWTSDPVGFSSTKPNPSVAPQITTRYFLTATNFTNCVGRDTVLVTVKPSPAQPTITPPGPVSFCQGGTILLTSSEAANYKWRLGGGEISGATGQSLEVSQTGSYSVETTVNSCTSFSAFVLVTVDGLFTPTISVTGSPGFCKGGSVDLFSNAGSNNQWYKDDVIINGATGNKYTATEKGVYTVIASINACGPRESAGVIVSVNEPPAIPVITQTGDTLRSSAPNNNQWYRNDTLIPGATGRIYIPTKDGAYTVRVTNSCGSGIAGAINYVAPPVIPPPPPPPPPPVFEEKTTVGPNPTTDYVTINFTGPPARFIVSVLDMTGREAVPKQEFTTTCRIDLSTCKTGYYILKIVNLETKESIQRSVFKL